MKVCGLIMTDPFHVLCKEKLFYQKLYSTSKNNNADNLQATELFLNNLNIPRLTQQQMLSCEGKITFEESAKVLESFQNNKAPGNDGIGHFTVVCSATKPMNGCEAAGDLALIQTSLLLSCKLCCCNAN